jgi:hypothetical protein
MERNMSFKIGSNFKGSGRPDGVPTFIDKLPIVRGGVIGALVDGAPAKMGRLVSVLPADPNTFLMGIPTGAYPVGILISDPAIMQNDPFMNDMYFEGRPATCMTFGMFDINTVDSGLAAGGIGMEVWANITTGQLGFAQVGGTPPSGTTYAKINAGVFYKDSPNGVKVWINWPLVAPTTSEAQPTVTTPTISPAAGAVPVGTAAYLFDATPDALIYYTVDGSTPTNASTLYASTLGGIIIGAGVTIKAIAYRSGYNHSAVLTTVYTIAP